MPRVWVFSNQARVDAGNHQSPSGPYGTRRLKGLPLLERMAAIAPRPIFSLGTDKES
jgi:hypothetical protein